MAKNLRSGPTWIPAVVVERLGPLSYLVETEDHDLWRRHVDLLKELVASEQSPSTSTSQPEVGYGGATTNAQTDVEPDHVPVGSSTVTTDHNPLADDPRDVPTGGSAQESDESVDTSTEPSSVADPTVTDPGVVVATPPTTRVYSSYSTISYQRSLPSELFPPSSLVD